MAANGWLAAVWSVIGTAVRTFRTRTRTAVTDLHLLRHKGPPPDGRYPKAKRREFRYVNTVPDTVLTYWN